MNKQFSDLPEADRALFYPSERSAVANGREVRYRAIRVLTRDSSKLAELGPRLIFRSVNPGALFVAPPCLVYDGLVLGLAL